MRAVRQQTSSYFDAKIAKGRASSVEALVLMSHQLGMQYPLATCTALPKGTADHFSTPTLTKLVLVALGPACSEHVPEHGGQADLEKKSYAFMPPKAAGVSYVAKKRRQHQ